MQTTHLLLTLLAATTALAQSDPGPRTTATKSGAPLTGATPTELAMFADGKEAFEEIDGVDEGLGPRFNLDSCVGCHAHPSTGGATPPVNPQYEAATKNGARNHLLYFMRPDGPAVAVRFKQKRDGSPDGGVHALFVITGRKDAAPSCIIEQEDFSNAANLTFRIPTPLFGAGLMESIADSALRANLAAEFDRKLSLGIRGRFNTNGNDGTITRFGWKAQNKSLTIFSAEAYNVEVGVTNELFPQERDETANCVKKASPEDRAHPEDGSYSDVDKFAAFMRLLAAPPAAPANQSIERGRNLFASTGCALCHTPSLRTATMASAALSQRDVPLYSDLAIHKMGSELNDGIAQGDAQPDEFRTAPLWGLGERLFLLHDGRTKDLLQAIRAHNSPGSEAAKVVQAFDAIPPDQKQDILNFLRSL